ncbi:hypothetical protein [Segetibacter koreensis]|uniref:hypothetical protein n=1 Tax=Segetibacter koreensis TaxID=398037 RepID=UPI0003771A01|nr:hypothetical protein [Segetibacter koreensis]
MESSYQTLSAIYDIVKSDPSPHTYLCTPQAIILRQTQDWASIQKNLEMLAAEQLITMRQLDKMVVCITAEGITKAKSIRNNFVNMNFSFSEEENTELIQKSLNPL